MACTVAGICKDQGLNQALPEEQPLQGIERPLPPLRGFEHTEVVLFGQGVQQPEDGRHRVFERLVQRQEVAGDLGPDRARIVPVVDPQIAPQEIDDGEVGGGAPIRRRR